MGSETLVQGHAFDFETAICTRCGMSEIEFEKQGEPQCSGKKPETPVGDGQSLRYGAGRVRATRNESTARRTFAAVDVLAEQRC